MKVALRVGMRADDLVNPLDGVLRDVKAMGYDGIELMLNTQYTLSQRGPWSSEDIGPEMRARFRQSAEKYGVEIASLSSDWAWGYARFCPRLSMWERGVEILKSDVELAGDLGAKVILMHVGTSQGTWEEISGIVKRVVEAGARRQVRVAFEAGIFARTGLGGLDALVRLVDEIGSPWFGVYEHCYWPRGTTQPHEEIALAGRRIKCLHSSALNVQVDYDKMLSALRGVGYDYYWVFEVPWEQAQDSVDGYRYLMRKYGPHYTLDLANV